VGVRGWLNGGETCAAGTESSGGRDREAGSGCDAVGEVDSAPAGSSEQPPPVRLLNGVPQQRPAAGVPYDDPPMQSTHASSAASEDVSFYLVEERSLISAHVALPVFPPAEASHAGLVRDRRGPCALDVSGRDSTLVLSCRASSFDWDGPTCQRAVARVGALR
jgi:hypothetical protein